MDLPLVRTDQEVHADPHVDERLIEGIRTKDTNTK